MVRDLVREWVDEKVIPIIENHYAKGTFPMELMSEIGTMGLFGCNLKGYDCAGMSNVAYGLNWSVEIRPFEAVFQFRVHCQCTPFTPLAQRNRNRNIYQVWPEGS